MFYEHVSRQSTVDTSKHRQGKVLMLQQIYFSLHHTSSHVVDFQPVQYTIISPFLLCFPFLPVHAHHKPQTTDTPQCSRANIRPLTCQPKSISTTVHGVKPQSVPSTSGSWKQADARWNTPRRSMYTCRFLSYAYKTNSYFLELNFLSSFITNINILTLKALSHLPVSFCFSFFFQV